MLWMSDLHKGQVLVTHNRADIRVWTQVLLLLVAHKVWLLMEVRLLRACRSTQI